MKTDVAEDWLVTILNWPIKEDGFTLITYHEEQCYRLFFELQAKDVVV
jgi:hypothetical protein